MRVSGWKDSGIERSRWAVALGLIFCVPSCGPADGGESGGSATGGTVSPHAGGSGSGGALLTGVR